MDIARSGSQPSRDGDPRWFVGPVRIEPLFNPFDKARAQGSRITFEPRSRTNWHTHPLGQILVIVSGLGRVGRWGGPVEEVHPGDVVWFAPGEKHWHGAGPTSSMVHLAVQEAENGSVVEWMEPVSDEQYGG